MTIIQPHFTLGYVWPAPHLEEGKKYFLWGRVWSHVGKSYWGEVERKKCMFKTLLLLLLLYCLLGLGRIGGVGGLEPQTNEDIAKKST